MATSSLGYSHPSHNQNDCLLFTKIPKEIRDQIFDVALSPSKKLQLSSCPGFSSYSRQEIGVIDGKLSTALVRTCQRIHDETRHLLSRNYVKIDWMCIGLESYWMHFGNLGSRSCLRNIQNLHLFTAPEFFSGETGSGGDNMPTYASLLAWQAPNLRFLKITTGWSLLFQHPAKHLLIDSREHHKGNQGNSFSDDFWGYQLRAFRHLKCFELEIVAVEEEKQFLDLKAASTVGWRLPLASGSELTMKSMKARREGWYGPEIGSDRPRYLMSLKGNVHWLGVPLAPPDLSKAKERLVNARVNFIDDTNPTSGYRLVFYALTLVFEASKARNRLL